MTCKHLFDMATAKFKGAPVKLELSCHAKAHCDVYLHGDNKTVTVCCSICDRPVGTFKVKFTRGLRKSKKKE